MLHLALSVLTAIAFAGGGGSGGGGGGGGFSGGGYSSDGSGTSGGPFSYAFFIFWVVVFVVATIYGKRAIAKRRRKTAEQIDASGAADPAWNSTEFVERAEAIFRQYQLDWQNYDLESMRGYMSDAYFAKNQLMVLALQQIYRRNEVSNIVIRSVDIINMSDQTNNDDDRYSASIAVTAVDALYDTRDNLKLYSTPASVTETYNFIRRGDAWLLNGIDEATADISTQNPGLVSFAYAHGFFYSLDWGRLLLPRYGHLFGGSHFEQSDINNHCIGMYHGLLVQMYTYSLNIVGAKSYVIAQIALPKSYGRIVVRHRQRFGLPIRGLRRVVTEWNDFNKKYDVFATDAEQATSFELLNPAFMERLERYDAEINIEVVDNIVYLYAPNHNTGSTQYETMFDVLEESFKELKM